MNINLYPFKVAHKLTRSGKKIKQWIDSEHSLIIRYGLAMLMVMLTTGMISLLRLTILGHTATIQLLYLLGVMLTAIIAGTGPAFLSAVLSLLYASYFFVEPRYDFRMNDAEQGVRLVAFLAIALLAGGLAAHARTQAAYARKRLDEQRALYELSQLALQGMNHTARLQQMARTVAEALSAPYCAIQISDSQGQPEICACWGNLDKTLSPEIIPLTGQAGNLGLLEIILSKHPGRSHADHQLLFLLAHQVAQSCEQTRLMAEAAQVRLLAESDRLKTAILSSVSHDLHTPLTTIRGAVDELQATDITWSPEHRQQLLVTISEQTRRLHNLVTHLLDLSRIRAGAVRPHMDWYALDEIIMHAVDTHQAWLSSYPLTIELPPDLPLLHLDFKLTEQVLVNLLRNAVTYTAPDTSICIQGQLLAHSVVVAISDQGPGIPARERQRIFEPFYRLAVRADRPGSGMGLAICQGFIKAQGGQIWVEDNPGGGARFCFTLPLGSPHEKEESYEPDSHNSSGY